MPGPVIPTRHNHADSIGTFTPKFIKTLRSKNQSPADNARDLAEFSGKRWVWLKDDKLAFVKGWVVEDNGTTLQVRCDNESTDRTVNSQDVDKVNPPKLNLADDMADLTYLNEASVIHNLRQRSENDLIYVSSCVYSADTDILGIVPGHSQSIPEYSHIRLRLC